METKLEMHKKDSKEEQNMKLTLQSVEGFDNKFTLEIEGMESITDALNMQRAICRSAVEYTR